MAVHAACACLAALAAAPQAQAGALPDPDLSPTIATIGLPLSTDGAHIAPRGQLRWRSSITTASHATQQTGGNELLLFDGETTKAALTVEYGVTDRLQLGIELPYLLHESGGLDDVVDTWHGWFGLPDGIRNGVPQDQLDFLYQVDGDAVLNVYQNQRGIGDVRVLAAWRLHSDARVTKALRASLKLPTGDSNALTGSGNGDFSLGIAADYRAIRDNTRWSGFYRAHVVVVGQPDRLGERAKPLIAVVAGGISARINPRLELTVQGKLRSAAYASELRVLGDPALLLTLGGTISLSERLQLAVAVGEDIFVESAPDVSFGLSLRYAPTAR